MFSRILLLVQDQARRIIHDSLGLPRSAKRIIVILIDACLALAAVWLAFYLRLGAWNYLYGSQWIAALLSLSALPIFWLFGLYRALFRHIGLEALVGIARACFVYAMFYSAVFLLLGVHGVPRTVGLIQPLLYFLALSISRIALGSVLGNMQVRSNRTRVLIYGAGASGRQLASAVIGSREMDLQGFVDDDRLLQRSVLNGKHIYSPSLLPKIVEKRGISDILLAMPSASRKRRGEILDQLRKLNVNVRTVPGLMDLANGRVEVNALRPLDIEDLLGRDPVEPDEALFARHIRDKVVMVTGAGGSIGSELCRQILRTGPRTLILFEQNEYSLYAIDRELKAIETCLRTTLVPLLGSVRDASRLATILDAWRPDTLYHAAAYKHVPLVEENIAEGVWNNAFGTYRTALAACSAGVENFVLISTDKAVRPTNVMGATKRLAELSLQALAEESNETRFSMVRFGNVLGSSGSVVPLFRSQISRGGPLTITHPEVTRYFMTIPEAAQLVIQAGAMAEGGEVFLLDMGEPVRVADLAYKMIELSGSTVKDDNNPDGDIEVTIVGLRPGEKLHEELLIGDDPIETRHPLILKSREAHMSMSEFSAVMLGLEGALERFDTHAIHELLKRAVPEFRSSGVIDLVHMVTQPRSEGRAVRQTAQPERYEVE